MRGNLSALIASASSDVVVEPIPFSACDGWFAGQDAIEHSSGGFFSIVAGENTATSDKRIALYQPQSPIVGLLATRHDGERLFLLQARTEPGATNPAQLGPSIQASPAAFGLGSRTPFIEHFSVTRMGFEVVFDRAVSDLGERYAGKQKRSILADFEPAEEIPDGFAWIGSDELVPMLGESFIATTDLRSSLSEAPWSVEVGTGELTPRSEAVRSSLASVDLDVLGEVLAACAQPVGGNERICSLASLELEQFDDEALVYRQHGDDLTVRGFRVEVHGREVRSWNQPLMQPGSQGRHVLAVRNIDRGLEVFVRTGTSAGFRRPLVYPTFSLTAGSATAAIGGTCEAAVAGPALVSVLECEEGGRFYHSLNSLEVVAVSDPDSLHGGHWISIGTLKQLLSMPMVCSIQLRSVASLLLALEA